MTGEVVLAPVNETEILRQQLLQAQRLSSVGELASSIAHEFNNILTTIINSAKLGMRNPESVEKQQAFDRIVKAGQRAATIAGGMLGFARKSGTHRQKCDIARLVEEVLILTEKDLSKHRVQVETRLLTRPLGVGRAGADRTDPHQPRHQRAPGDADRRAAQDRSSRERGQPTRSR